MATLGPPAGILIYLALTVSVRLCHLSLHNTVVMQPINIASFFFAQPPARKGSESGPAKQSEDFSVPYNGEKILSENQGSQCEISTADSVGPPKMQTQVHGCYHSVVHWVIPDEIDLDDKETYDFGDVWGILYIFNKKTGETIELANFYEEESDLKRCQELHISTTGEYSDEEEVEEVHLCACCRSKLHQ